MRVVRNGGFAPRGERLVRRAAKLAGFDGTIELISGPRVDSGGNHIQGEFAPPSHITLWTSRKGSVDFFAVLCHELGHYSRHVRGKYNPVANYRERADYHRDPEERAANRYAAKLMKELGL